MGHGPVIGILLHDFALGGTERVAIRLGNAWRRMGCRVRLYVGQLAGVQRDLIDPAVEIIEADPPIARSPWSRLALGSWFGRRCAGDGVEAIFLPGNFYFVTIGRINAATGGSIPVFTKVSNVLWRPDRSWLRNCFFRSETRRRLRNVRCVVAMSQALRTEASEVLGDDARLAVVPDPVLEALPEPDESQRRRWHLCAVGRLEQQKNFRLLLETFALITDLPVTLTIAGDGTQAKVLAERARCLGISDRVQFVGAVRDVHRVLAQAEVLVLTSDFEGYPAVIIEALAAGTYVVARNCSPAIPEVLVTPRVGRVVDGSDPRDFAAALRQYFARRNRDPLRMREVVARHAAAATARQYLQAFGLAGPDPVLRPDPIQHCSTCGHEVLSGKSVQNQCACGRTHSMQVLGT
jgi:glycosyltransferase involved in cell wall biosynthesis